ncbi:MAG TPA: hypothetical protein VK735_25690 [Pseudonocardia sp.]|uniref:hypothetical protein n=1 Tax=Pseudonocardia sp. TaxID=60912 RepID=UPI002D13E09D|nr:hypothetical protein [Pseudonocardia sp.]HTF50849.1 hypothetical protein [Pseudonocardia sp.]
MTDEEAGIVQQVRQRASRVWQGSVRWLAGNVRLVTIALLVTAVLLAGGLLTLWRVAGYQRDSQAAGQDALVAAREAAVAMLSYDYRTVDGQLAKASELVTGPFQGEFRNVTSTLVAPAAKQKQVSTHAQVVAASVVAAAPGQVTTLLFLNQTTQGAGLPAPSISGSRVRLSMTEVAGRWLVAAMTPV